MFFSPQILFYRLPKREDDKKVFLLLHAELCSFYANIDISMSTTLTMLDHDEESLRVQPDEIIPKFYDFSNARIEILILNVRHGTLNFILKNPLYFRDVDQ